MGRKSIVSHLCTYVRTYVCARGGQKNDLLANCSLLQFMAEKQTKDTSKQKLPFLLLHSLISSSMRKKGRQDMYPAHDFEGGEKCSWSDSGSTWLTSISVQFAYHDCRGFSCFSRLKHQFQQWRSSLRNCLASTAEITGFVLKMMILFSFFLHPHALSRALCGRGTCT